MNNIKINISILNSGYSYRDNNSIYHADCTSSTIQYGDQNILVDTRGSWSASDLLESLNLIKLNFSSITTVICTHGHSDHTGNLYHFSNILNVVGYDINKGDQYYDSPLKDHKPYEILENRIEVWPTPGHTAEDISIVIYDASLDGQSFKVIAIVGDLFECENDDDIFAMNSFNPTLQLRNREKILKIADVIIPGHGKYFINKKKQRNS